MNAERIPYPKCSDAGPDLWPWRRCYLLDRLCKQDTTVATPAECRVCSLVRTHEQGRIDSLEAKVERLKERVRVEANEAMCQKARADHVEGEKKKLTEALREANEDTASLGYAAPMLVSAVCEYLQFFEKRGVDDYYTKHRFGLMKQLVAENGLLVRALAAHEKRQEEAGGVDS